MDPDAIDHLEVTVVGFRIDRNTKKKPEYVRTMNLDVKNIDKMI